jgi:outer membrane protein assembly factor BamD (BamD/ComL family)
MRNKFLTFCWVTVAVFFSGCAVKRFSYEQQLLSEADSLFKVGNYEYAKVKYAKIRDAHPETDVAKTAQFYLGYINVFYDNPFANWEASLREFRMFATLFPQDYRIGEVNSWIRILTVMQSYKKEYQGTINKLDQIKAKELIKDNEPRAIVHRINIDSIAETLRKCFDDRDSLVRKTKDLENAILDLEKTCQGAVR